MTALRKTFWLVFQNASQKLVFVGFRIWDWGTGAKTTVCQNKSSKMISSKVTALEWINGHDIAMLMVASDDGSVKLWKPNVGMSREPSLISAWQAFGELKPTEKRAAGKLYFGGRFTEGKTCTTHLN